MGAKRRRTKAEVEAEKEEEQLREEGIQAQLQELEQIKAERDAYKEKAEGNEAADLILKDLIQKGELEHLGDGSVAPSKKKPRGRPPRDRTPSKERDENIQMNLNQV